MSWEVNTILQQLPPYKGNMRLIKWTQDTFDIIHEILEKHRKCQRYYDRIAPEFWKGSTDATARHLYNFARLHLPYKVEPKATQTTKTPQAILAERLQFGNDCKHYASFCIGVGSALKRLGYPVDCFYRFASYDRKRKAPAHVFAVFRDHGKDIWVDPVPQISGYDSRNIKPVFITDKRPPMALYSIEGIGYGGFSPQNLVSGLPAQEIIGTLLSGPDDIGRFNFKKLALLSPTYQMVYLKKLLMKNPTLKGFVKNDPRLKLARKLGVKLPAHLSGPYGTGGGYSSMSGRKGKKKIKPGKLFKKIALAPSRNSFLLLVKINTFHLATKMWNKAAKDRNSPQWKKLANTWRKLGGNENQLYKDIKRGVHTWNKFHKNKRIAISGYDDPYQRYNSGIVEGVPEDVGALDYVVNGYHDDMSIGDILCFVHDNHTIRMRRAHRKGGSVGVAPAVAAAGVIAAAAPIIKALANILKSFGINTKKADDAAGADTENVVKDYEQGTENPDGSVTTKDGKNIQVTDNPDGTQTMAIKKMPGMSTSEAAGQEAADNEGDEEDGYTKTKTVTKTKHRTGSNGAAGGGVLDTIKNFVGENKVGIISAGAGVALLAGSGFVKKKGALKTGLMIAGVGAIGFGGYKMIAK